MYVPTVDIYAYVPLVPIYGRKHPLFYLYLCSRVKYVKSLYDQLEARHLHVLRKNVNYIYVSSPAFYF